MDEIEEEIILPTLDLEGSWSWIESGGGIGGIVSTPSSTGDTGALLITKDSIIYSFNGVITIKDAYEIKFRTFENGINRGVFFYKNSLSSLKHSFDFVNNKLSLSLYKCNDCGYSSYIKISD